MNHTEHPARRPSSATGFRAALRVLLPVQGIGAPPAEGIFSRAGIAALTAICATVYVLAFDGAPALALQKHVLSGSFGSEGSGSGQLKEPTGVAVNDATHDVYVADSGNNRVEEFNSTGTEVLAEFNGLAAPTGPLSSPGGPNGIAVDNSGEPVLEDPSVGDVYVVDRGHKVIDKFSSSGTYLGQLTGTCASAGTCAGKVIPFGELDGVAVDSSGTVWVSQTNLEIDNFVNTAENEFHSKRAVTDSYLEYGCEMSAAFAVDAEDNMYIPFCGEEYLDEFTSTGSILAEHFTNFATSVAVDLSTNVMYLDTGNEAKEFSARALVESFGSGDLADGGGIAVDSSNGTVYAADSAAGAVKFFDEVTFPDVTTNQPSSVTPTSATFNGTVDPDGLPVTSCIFEYGAEAGVYTHSVPCKQSPSGTEPVAVSAEVMGLARRTTYHYRLVATNANGTSPTSDQELFTGGLEVFAASVSDVASSSAIFQANIDPNGVDLHYYFQYGTGASYGTDVPALPGADLGSEKGAREVPGLRVDGLQPNSTYHYRVVAVEGGETISSSDHTFTTQASGAEPGLPDGRAWEMVSPAETGGAEVGDMPRSLYGGVMQAAENGDAIVYFTTAPLGAGQLGNPSVPQALSRRDPGGWSTQDINPAHSEAIATELAEKGAALAVAESNGGGEFLAFSPDLSLAYISPSRWSTSLVPPAPVPPYEYFGGSEGYVRDENTGSYAFTKLSVGEWYDEQVALAHGAPSCDGSASPARGEGVDAVSQDGCYVYFNSESLLAPGATGKDPLYVSHDEGGKWITTFISSLSSPEGAGDVPWGGEFVELSPNGQYVAFMSNASLTGYDNEDVTSRHAGERMDQEVYLYDAAGNRLVCASCNPTGARPAGQFDFSSGNTSGGLADEVLVDPDTLLARQWLGGVLPARWMIGQGHPDPHQPRYLTDSGKLFFDSRDTLVPQAANGVENVYEYEPKGVGGCLDASGCVSLLSSGTSSQESALVEATPSGEDVFFITASQLVPQATASGYKMYDAHVCSASVPCPQSEATTPPCDTGDSCKPSPSPQPAIYGSPSSATFHGAGNIVPAGPGLAVKRKAVKCRKGKKLRDGKCVAKLKARRKRTKGRK